MTGQVVHITGDRWRVRVYAGTGVDGKQKLKSRSFRADGERAAKKAAVAIIAAIDAELAAARQKAPTAGTVGEMAAEWLALKTRDCGPLTVRGYTTHVTALKGSPLARIQVTKLTGREIDAWYGSLLATGMSPNTVGHYHRTLRSILRLAEKYGLAASVATRQSTPPKMTHYEVQPPTTSALTVLMESAHGDLRVALHTLAGTGLRRSEVVGLRWSDLEGATLRVERTVVELRHPARLAIGPPKSGRSRSMALDGDLISVLRDHRATLEAQAEMVTGERALGDDSYMFPNLKIDPRGRVPRRPGWLSYEWARIQREHGSKVRLHDLRHWHATTLIDLGMPIPTVSKRLGHAQVSTTLDIYAHAVAGSDAQAASIIGEALRPRQLTSAR